MLQAKAATTLASSETGIVSGEWREGANRSLLLDQGRESSDVDMSVDHKEELHSLVTHLGAGIRDTHYQLAYNAAANVYSSTLDMIPIDLHDAVHVAVIAGYAAELSDLEEGKLDDQVRERSEIIE
ncbi:hypothetical protein [Streptomyces sp. NPDC093223]|uniref:hypothetical protein n=1 Tax=Streptomyces sp. NPDC093223 TaxID=3366033 RepID=UPI00382BB197